MLASCCITYEASTRELGIDHDEGRMPAMHKVAYEQACAAEPGLH